jgi:hypothetical protein
MTLSENVLVLDIQTAQGLFLGHNVALGVGRCGSATTNEIE